MQALQSMTAKCIEIEDELGEREGAHSYLLGLMVDVWCVLGDNLVLVYIVGS